MSDFFPYEFDRRWNGLFAVLGVRRSHGVTITDDGRLHARYGWASVDTPLDNVKGAVVDGPHRWYTAVGLRLSFADDGITFGTNHRRGVCIEFHERVKRVVGFRPHSALWVSVADPDGLADALNARMDG